jgi:glycosyltransferase involved in cell wall biosynthesis
VRRPARHRDRRRPVGGGRELALRRAVQEDDVRLAHAAQDLLGADEEAHRVVPQDGAGPVGLHRERDLPRQLLVSGQREEDDARGARQPVGPAVPQLGDARARRNGYPDVGGDTAQIEKTGMRALMESVGILGTCIREAPEFLARRRTRQRARSGQAGERHNQGHGTGCRRPSAGNIRMGDITSGRTTSTSSRSCRRSARGSARSAASTTRRKRSANWHGSSSRSSSTRGVRSDLLAQFRQTKAAMPAPPNFAFEDSTLFDSHRGIIRFIRKILKPILKLFFNPNPLIQALHIQSALNTRNAQRENLDALHYELIHNLVLETTRLGIEVKNLKMRLESMSSRLDFDERRARALEGVVQYRPGAVAPLPPPRGRRPGRRGSGRTAQRRRRRRGRRRDGARRDRRGPDPRPVSRGWKASGRRGRWDRPEPSPDRARGREARDRRPALRRRHQRRRGTARAVHRRAARAHAEVEVLTTCARDYVTWRNECRRARRRSTACPCGGSRSARARSRGVRPLSQRVFEGRTRCRRAGVARGEGPEPAALDHAARRGASTTSCSSATATTTPGTAPAPCTTAPSWCRRPSATRRSGCRSSAAVFRGVRAIMYNSPEERAMIQAAAGNEDVPGRGGRRRLGDARARRCRAVPAEVRPARPFAIYVGRIDENKGCAELFDFFQRYAAPFRAGSTSCSCGHSIIPIPDIPRIRHLGFLPTPDKFDALAAADLLIMPSYFESLSMVALEAWALGRPVLANGRCDVLKGQCIRSNAGLYYETTRSSPRRSTRSSRTGRSTRARAQRPRVLPPHYAWPVIERKYLDMLERLRARTPGAGRPVDRAAAGLVGAAAPRTSRRPRACCAGPSGRPSRASSAPAGGAACRGRRDARARPPGARHARLRRRHRPRGARHPARAARRRGTSRRSSSRRPTRASST